LIAKTDKLDAFNLAAFGKQIKLRQFEAKSEDGRYISALLVRRRQVEEMLKAEKSRLRMLHAQMRSSLERIMGVLKEEINQLDKELEGFMAEHESMKNGKRKNNFYAVRKEWGE
jgi:transposase